MSGRMSELKTYALAVTAGRKTPALYNGDLMRHVSVHRIMRDRVHPGLRDNLPWFDSCDILASQRNCDHS
jgi:hypothetical protein